MKNKISRYKVVESGDHCKVYDGSKEIECFDTSNDLRKTLTMLKEINALRSDAGIPIYQNYALNGIFFWSLFQDWLFSYILSPYVKYRDLIQWWSINIGLEIPTGLESCDNCISIVMQSSVTRPVSLFQKMREPLEVAILLINAIAVGIYRRLTGAKFLLWCLNCVSGTKWIDYRMKDIYQELWSRHVSFVEAFPFPGFKAALQRLLGSRRLCLFVPNVGYIQPSAIKNTIHFDYEGEVKGVPQEHLIGIIKHVERMIANTQKSAQIFVKMLQFTGFRKVYAIDEHTSFAPLIYACTKLNIDIVGLQHGAIHEYSAGWTSPGIPHCFTMGYDKILVWGQYWRNLLAKLSNIYNLESLIPVGNIRPSTISLKPRCKTIEQHKKFHVLLIYEFLANPKETFAYVESFRRNGYAILFKLRFDTPIDEQLGAIPREWVQLVPEVTQEIVNKTHVCAGCATSLMYEFYYLGLPVWHLSMKLDNNRCMVEAGLASLVTLDDLDDPEFDPFKHRIFPDRQSEIFESEGIPSALISMI